MKIEKIINKTSNKCLNITASKVDSLRINNDLENTIRVYSDGAIGVAGGLGEVDFYQLQQRAKDKIKQGIAYPETHDQVVVKSVDTTKQIFTEEQFIPAISHLLQRLSQENPEFLFSNKVLLNSSESYYNNDDGSELNYKGNSLTIALSIKYKGSANIMDEFYGVEANYFDEDAVCADVKMKCDAFLNDVDQVEEDEITVIGELEPLQHAIQHFIADMYFNNSSLLNGKLGEKIFDEKVSVLINRDPSKQLNIKFFDAEGVVNENYRNYLVKNGVFEKTITCKKSADMYNTQNSGSAGASYDGVPSAGIGGLEMEETACCLDKLVKGKAIYLSVTSGGDMTPSGDISLPSMVSYLYQDGKLVGKLPEFAVCGNLFDILGKDFVGYCNKGFFSFGEQSYFVYKAKLANKSQKT